MIKLCFVKGTPLKDREEIYNAICKAFPEQAILYCGQSYDIDGDSIKLTEKGAALNESYTIFK